MLLGDIRDIYTIIRPLLLWFPVSNLLEHLTDEVVLKEGRTLPAGILYCNDNHYHLFWW